MRWGPPPAPALAGVPVAPRRAAKRDDFTLRFDANNWQPTPGEPEPLVRRMSDRDERVALTLMVVVLLLLMFLPLSMGMLVDVVRYLRG